MDRRQFLKMAGFSSLLGIGSLASFELMRPGWLEASEVAAPAAGVKRLAMVIDVSKFGPVDYKKAVEACHSIHNVPDFRNPKDEIKWIWTEKYENTFPGTESQYLKESVKEKPFLVLCNHCQNPPCVRVCPTKATFKREQDGIVAMDYHRCIGCRFCMAACPYGSRSFNWRDPREDDNKYLGEINKEFPTRTKGVVEKCNFCVERLAKDLQPNCVESQKNNPGALYFGDINDSHAEVREVLRTHYTLRRKPALGTEPNVYYIIGGV
jgi:molybdopterin-containing oxidoreductase family iron-sulfur binding subunit